MPDRSEPPDALRRLDVLVGRWSVTADVPGAPTGSATLEWALGGSFLQWQVTIPDPSVPDSLSVISLDSDGEAFTQHYFDARGVARLYKMTLRDSTWTLLRDEEDFTPLEFSQRFRGMIASDGASITGAWEALEPGGQWRKDFDLVYRRVEMGQKDAG
jgi:hypothetical protein